MFYDVKLDLDDQVYIYQAESLHHFKLYEVYKISEGSAPIIRQFGTWSTGDEAQYTRKMIIEAKNYKRNDFGVSGLRFCKGNMFHSVLLVSGSYSQSYIIAQYAICQSHRR